MPSPHGGLRSIVMLLPELSPAPKKPRGTANAGPALHPLTNDKTSAPAVSVIVSTHNRLRLLELAIRSVLAQTFQDFELLICDDASTEDVAGLLKAFSDERIRLVPSTHNLGVAANNFRGYREARGRYLAHLDDDDEWTPNYLKVMTDALEQHPECSLAFSNHTVIDDRGRESIVLTERGEDEWGRSSLVQGVYMPFIQIAVVRRSIPTSHSSVLRASAIDLSRLCANVGYGWDLWLTYLAARDGAGAYFTPARLTRYRRHGSQQTGGATELPTYAGLSFCDRQFLADPNLAPVHHILKRRFAQTQVFFCVALLQRGRIADARAVLRTGLRIQFVPAALPAMVVAYLPTSLSRTIARAATRIVARRRVSRQTTDLTAPY